MKTLFSGHSREFGPVYLSLEQDRWHIHGENISRWYKNQADAGRFFLSICFAHERPPITLENENALRPSNPLTF